MSKFPYYKSLDGIRGIAVLLVLFHHSHLMPAGWAGVQVFFVLSGFLITSILMTQTEKPFAVFLRQFYWRRGLRIWPLYFLYVAICGVAFLIVSVPETWRTAWAPLVTFTYNFARISPHFQDSDYFGHFWTLCVEEQFYLVWPFLVFFLPRNQFQRFVLALVLTGPAIRFLSAMLLARHFDAHHVQMGVHNMPFSHLDAFASGALLAVMPVNFRQRLAPLASQIFIACIFVTMSAGLAQAWCLHSHGLPPHWLSFGYDDFEHFHQGVWGYTLLNLSGATLIFAAIESPVFSRLLSFRPLAFIGVISYGLYVWHLPLLRIFSIFWPVAPHSPVGLVRFAIYTTVSIGIAFLSYWFFERYFLSLKKRTVEASKEPSHSELGAGTTRHGGTKTVPP